MIDFDFNSKIKRHKRYKLLPSNCIVTADNYHNAYPHLTFRIKNLSEYLQIIKLLKAVNYEDQTLVYRGMTNCEWPAISSLARYNGFDETIEFNMVNEFMTLRPDAFQGLQSNFEILAKMQHYGLPTRLLDFTTNPLVALFFSCAKRENADGRVLCGSTFLMDSRNRIVNAICNSCRQYALNNVRLEDLLTGTGCLPYDYINKLYLIRDYRLIFVKPWYWNQRIINQRAVFLVFPNELYDHLGNRAYYYEQDHLDIDNADELEQIRIINESEKLAEIYPQWKPSNPIEIRLEEKRIEMLGEAIEDCLPKRSFFVSHETMTKLFSFHQKDEIIQNRSFEYTGYGQMILGRRFMLSEELTQIDASSMKTLFCSIIIDRHSKKEIMSDLESIGIDKAFIFPELEYTAEKVKGMYFYR